MMQKLFLDTNVVVDLLGERDSFYTAAARIATLADKGRVRLIVSALTYSTLYYLLSKFESGEAAKEKIRKFKVIAETSELTDKIVEQGLASNVKDFENALQYYCAVNAECNVLITRNPRDFKMSDIPVLLPDEYLKSLNNS